MPPRSPQASSSCYEFVTADDVRCACQAAGVPGLTERTGDVAEYLNDRMSDYCLWAAVQDRDGTAAQKADWAWGVARHARALLAAMGWEMVPGHDGQPFRDAMHHFSHGMPVTPREMWDMDGLILAGAPETWRQSQAEGEAERERVQRGWWQLMTNLRPSLVALILNAERAEAIFSAEIAHGGSEKDEPLHRLFQHLVVAFSAISGETATVSYVPGDSEVERENRPESAAMTWCLAILRSASAAARRIHGNRRFAPADSDPGAAILAGLAKRFEKAPDGLAHQVRQAKAAVEALGEKGGQQIEL